MVEESIHVIFDESDNGILSEKFKELNLNKYFDDISDDELDANDLSEVKRKNMQDTIQSLDEVEGKQVVNIKDSQPNLKTQSQELETAPEPIDLDTPIRNSSNEVGTSSLNDYTPSILCRRLRMSSQYSPENIKSDPTKVLKLDPLIKMYTHLLLFLLQTQRISNKQYKNQNGSLLCKMN